MKFDAQNYPYASKRSVVYAKNGMVCVGNPRLLPQACKPCLRAVTQLMPLLLLQPVSL